MKRPEQHLLLRSLSNELSEREVEELNRLLRDDAEIQAEYDNLVKTENILADARYESFGPSFADRVMERLGKKEESWQFSLSDALASLFTRIAPIAVAVALVLGIYNITASNSTESPIEAALGLHPVTVDAAYETALTDMILPQ
ncbi:MAG: hypothetical protein KDD67_03790 [Ignavibacteriae bacterium]|nr:hypothetical protein [Ignavibacteriota bacterium]MCB9215036.1 hypothetical protein [Ignavibacteria bacterium]